MMEHVASARERQNAARRRRSLHGLTVRHAARPVAVGAQRGALAVRRQRSEQYLTWSQSRSHFLRQLKGNWQCAQTFDGNSDFLRIFIRMPVLTIDKNARRRRKVGSWRCRP